MPTPRHFTSSNRRFLPALFAAFAFVACDGKIVVPATVEATPAAPVVPLVVKQVVADRFPRLSHQQWSLTVADLLHLEAPTEASKAFAPDPLGGKTFDNNLSALTVSPALWGNYQLAAEALAVQVTTDATLLGYLMPSPRSATVFLETFGRRAFRRPLT